MPTLGTTNIAVMWSVAEDDVAEGDRIFASHVEWMKGHPKDGDTALLDYRISKGPELTDPMDPNSAPTGRTIFTLNEIYASPAGVDEHWRQAIASWADLQAFLDWGKKGTVSTLHSGTVVQALW